MTMTDDGRATTNHPLLTVADVAEALGVGERFVRRLTAERRMPFLKIGAKVRFTREDLDAFVAASRREVCVPVDPDPLQEHMRALAEFWETDSSVDP